MRVGILLYGTYLYLVPVNKVLSQKYFREYASLLSHDFRIFTSLGELKNCKNRDVCVTILIR